MSKASELIERLEKETGQRIDEPGSMAMAGLFGALARAMDKTPASYTEKDDVAAGILIQHQMTPEYRQKKATDEMVANLLANGMSPEHIDKISKELWRP
jgi:uncharacterized protein (DUF2267 family)